MMTPQERRAKERDDMREKILNAARVLFAEKGYEAMTMRELASRIDYSTMAVYHHFKDKKALFQSLCDHDYRLMMLDLERITSEEKDVVKRLQRYAIEHIRYAIANRSTYQLLFLTKMPQLENIGMSKEEEAAAYGTFRTNFEELISQYETSIDNPDLLAMTYFTGLVGIASTEIFLSDQGKDSTIPGVSGLELAQAFVSIFLRGVIISKRAANSKSIKKRTSKRRSK